ncbi:hypothetical protein Tco_1429796 [Tanacetum coccineum]
MKKVTMKAIASTVHRSSQERILRGRDMDEMDEVNELYRDETLHTGQGRGHCDTYDSTPQCSRNLETEETQCETLINPEVNSKSSF